MLLHINDFLKTQLTNLFRLGILLIDRTIPHRKPDTDTGKILIVRLDAIGDFIIWLASAKEFRRLYPRKKIILIANSTWAGMAQELPYWDEVWPIDMHKFTRNPGYRWRLLCKVNRAGFEIAIQPTFSRVLLHGDSVIRASNATARIGSVGDLSNISAQDREIADCWYTQLLPASSAPMMELERNAEFFAHLSGKPCLASLPQLATFTNLPIRLHHPGDYFILFPGASWHGKQWPVRYFATVMDQLYQRYGWRAILCGSLAERKLCQAVAEQATAATINLAGKTTLIEFAELIRGARLLIGNDTSAVHIATAVGTPSVCVLGGGHYGRFMPYPEAIKGTKPLVAVYKMPCFNCNWHCNQPHDLAGPVPCVSSMTVEKVLHLAIKAAELSTGTDIV